MVTPSHFDLPEGGGKQTRQHLKDLPMLQYFNTKFGNLSEEILLWHSDMELENLLDPGSQKVSDM
jgi:hypothetical protein